MDNVLDEPRDTGGLPWVWAGMGVVLVLVHIILVALSHRFAHGSDVLGRPIRFLVFLEVLLGVVYLAAIWLGVKVLEDRSDLIFIVVIGVVIRGMMIFSTPMQEDDFYRYLWDGGVLAHGYNPYEYAPGDVAKGSEFVPEGLRQLGRDAGSVLRRVNHSELRTIYPPVAQIAFTVAYIMKPWSLLAWRFVLLACDVAALILLLRILDLLDVPVLFVAIYWWNPVLIKEVYNSGHMDMVALPLVLGAVGLMIRGRSVGAIVCLALAVGVKIWPVLLLPIFLRALWPDQKRVLTAALLFAAVSVLLFTPVLLAGLDGRSGLVAYGRKWEMNDALFMVFTWLGGIPVKLFHLAPEVATHIARVLVALILIGLMIWSNRKRVEDGLDLCGRALFIVAALFLLSPTEFPWYYMWLLPFLAILPRASLLLLTALLPIYYLRFHFAARGEAPFFDYRIVWIEYAPVWILLAVEWWWARRATPPTEPELPDEGAAETE